MENVSEIEISVAYATPSRQREAHVRLPAGSTIEEAIRRSGLLAEFPDIDLTRCKVGVYGEVLEPGTILQGGERVEIYRSLVADPKEARRRRGRATDRNI